MDPAGRLSRARTCAPRRVGVPAVASLPGSTGRWRLANDAPARGGARHGRHGGRGPSSGWSPGSDESLGTLLTSPAGCACVQRALRARVAPDPVISRLADRQVIDGRTRLRPRPPSRPGRRRTSPNASTGRGDPRSRTATHRLHRADPVDLALATGNPVHLLRRRGVPVLERSACRYVLDDRDGWLLDVYTGEARPRPPGSTRALLTGTDRRRVGVVVRQRAHRRLAPAASSPTSPTRSTVVENGWDRDLLDVAATAATDQAGR